MWSVRKGLAGCALNPTERKVLTVSLQGEQMFLTELSQIHGNLQLLKGHVFKRGCVGHRVQHITLYSVTLKSTEGWSWHPRQHKFYSSRWAKDDPFVFIVCQMEGSTRKTSRLKGCDLGDLPASWLFWGLFLSPCTYVSFTQQLFHPCYSLQYLDQRDLSRRDVNVIKSALGHKVNKLRKDV